VELQPTDEHYTVFVHLLDAARAALVGTTGPRTADKALLLAPASATRHGDPRSGTDPSCLPPAAASHSLSESD
jgi:hypothetical protein